MFSTKYEQVPETPTLKYTPTKFVPDRHNCTDPLCALAFIFCLGFAGHITSYAYQNGDPRKVFHGMDWQGRLCGVDDEVLSAPYVYWCAKTSNSFSDTGGVSTQVTDLDLHHPICVELCPNSPATSHQCYDAESVGQQKTVPDYATHPVARRNCLPQATELIDMVEAKLSGHPFEKYLPIIVATVREGWPCLAGAFGLAFGLSFLYLIALEYLAGLVMWICTTTLVLFPSIIGGTLIYVSLHDGVDGIPSSGDSQTDLQIGIGCLCLAAFFLLVHCCMASATTKAVKSVEAAAACMFHTKSLLLEPVLNLAGRCVVWVSMLMGLAWLISVGDVRKSKIYRTFTYEPEELIYIIFYVVMILWLNDLCNAVSQYAVANATARWYFTERVGGTKLVPSCLLCQGYVSGCIYHFGSLAFGALVIAVTRPLRMILLVLIYAGEATDNGVCGCLSRACSCCKTAFESAFIHLSKHAYIDMAISSKGFCAAGRNAAQLLHTEHETIAAAAGASWLFALSGVASVTTFGAFVTSFIVQNTATFTDPASKYYIQDPMVMAFCAGVVSFFVALCFMLVFDTVADTMLVCLAYDLKDQRENPAPLATPKAQQQPQQSVFASFFGTKVDAEAPVQKRPQYAHDELMDLLTFGK
jgi:hypothetical protein